MNRNRTKRRGIVIWPLTVGVSIALAGLPLLVPGCDQKTDSSKSTTTKTTQTPEGTKKTTETTEKKTETQEKP